MCWRVQDKLKTFGKDVCSPGDVMSLETSVQMSVIDVKVKRSATHRGFKTSSRRNRWHFHQTAESGAMMRKKGESHPFSHIFWLC